MSIFDNYEDAFTALSMTGLTLCLGADRLRHGTPPCRRVGRDRLAIDFEEPFAGCRPRDLRNGL